ncbi:MAG: ABC transporter permease [bacterium]|nr:ABC transporter permease [bacterium]
MNKTGLIFRKEFVQAVTRAGFVVMTLIVPVLALLAIGVTELVTTLTEPSSVQRAAIGYVDETGIITDHVWAGETPLVRFDSSEEATGALARREIGEYVVIPADYTTTGIARRYTLEKELGTPPHTEGVLKSFIAGNLLKDEVEPHVAILVIAPLNLEVIRITESGDMASVQNSIGNIIVPGVFSFLLSLALMFGASALVNGLGEEKESHLIEVLLSSVSIRQLLVGKVLALGAAGLLQVLVWLVSAPLLLELASGTFGGFMSGIQVPGGFLVLGIVYFLLGYLLFAVLSLGIGAISASAREGSNLSLFYIMTGFAPLWFASLLFAFPNSPAWTVLSIFPVTAPVQTMLRLGVSDIPVWQIMTSIGVLALSVVVGMYFAVRIFRAYMLMYGKRPGIAEIVRSLKNA